MSVYILHCQADFGIILWKLSEPSMYADTVYLPLVYLIITFGVFFFACTIEFFRTKLFKICNIDNISSKFVSFCNKGLERLVNFI